MAKENLKGLEDADALKLHRGIFGASRYEGVAWRAERLNSKLWEREG